tara:strand:- start:5175 stop:6317 length:1143 start_codon:yes stop_codon:yes gene_type:complete
MKSKIILLSSINILLNNYFYQFLVFLFLLKGEFVIISEITFLLAPLIFLKESFSSNQRTVLLSDKRLSLYKVFFKQRILYATLTLIIYLFFINYFVTSEDILFLIIIVILIKFMWFNELTITSYEINSDKKKIIENLIFLIILYMFFSYYIFFPSKNLLFIPLIILVALTFKYTYSSKISFNIYKNIEFPKKINYRFLSTICLNLSNLIWRVLFFILLEKEYSGILFSVFAIMSFPSSLYSNTIGMSLETQYKSKNIFKFILMVYYFIIMYVMYYIFVNTIIPLNNSILSNFSITTGLLSFVGSLIMIFAVSKRIKIINYQKLKRKTLFQLDILYSIINVLSLATVYIILGSYFFSILFLISSIFSLIYYFYNKKLNYSV